MIPETDFAARQIQGGRPYQEDFYAFSRVTSKTDEAPGEILLALADGMGGHCAGDYASHLAVEGFLRGFHHATGNTGDRLRHALESANRHIADCIDENPQLIADMGTTLVGLATDGRKLQWISVGDSLLFLFRNGKLKRLNEDHSLAPILQARVAHGMMTADEAAHHPDRNTLRSALVGDTIEMIDHPGPLDLEGGDILLIATDGLLSLTESFLQNRLSDANGESAASLCETLLREVEGLSHPRQDNTTVAIIKMPPLEKEPS
jgi:protein phosphatase